MNLSFTPFRTALAAGAFLAIFALSGCSKPGDSLVTQAMNAYSAKDYDAALGFFQQALDADTRYSDEILYGFIASIYTHQEDWDKAADYQEKSLAKKADYRGYVSLGMLRHYAGDDQRAQEAYATAIAMDGSRGEAYASLAALYMGQGRGDEAVPLLEKAVALDPKIALFQANLAVAYAMCGDSEKSEEALRQAEALKCENLPLFRSRAQEALEKAARQ